MNFTLLVIDDEKNIREGLATDFEMDGYNVKVAANGQEGIDFLEKGNIDLVITDLRMPVVSGEDVLKKFISYVTDYATVEKAPSLDGKWLTCVLASKTKK